MDEEKPYAVAVFEDEDLAVAIGRNGHNIKLASKVTGYTIDSVKRSDHEGESVGSKKTTISNDSLLNDIDGITDTQSSNFSDNNIKTVSDFLNATQDELLSTKGIGEKSLEKISDLVKNTKD